MMGFHFLNSKVVGKGQKRGRKRALRKYREGKTRAISFMKNVFNLQIVP